MSFDHDLTACAQLVERGDPDRFAAAMAAPVEARRVLFPIYAFNVEVSRAPWVTKEPMIAEMRLQWWRDALAEIGAGGTVRRHEVVTPLAGCLDAAGAELLDSVAAARRWDIYRDPFEDAGAFDRFIEETAGHLMLASARALGEVDRQAMLDLGYAQGLAAFLVAVPALEAQGRIPLVDGRREAVALLARGGLERLARARRARRAVGPAARAACLAAWKAEPLLRLAAREPARVAEGGLAISEARVKLRLIWQASTGRW